MRCTRPRQTESRKNSNKKDDHKRAELPVIASLECTKGESPVEKWQNLLGKMAKKGLTVVEPVEFDKFVI